jgi:uncharacterized membrane protein YeaQ/YmgE (transglycosylase-associated protein family)
VITLGQILGWLVVGLVVGAIARVLSHDRERAAWLFVLLVAVCGAFVGGFIGYGVGLSRPHEPAGFALSLVGAMIFASTYLRLRRRLSLP